MIAGAVSMKRTRPFRIALLLALFMALMLPLAACGQKGPPGLPEGTTDRGRSRHSLLLLFARGTDPRL